MRLDRTALVIVGFICAAIIVMALATVAFSETWVMVVELDYQQPRTSQIKV
jgi:hypothetical protein